ncbi:MAG: 3-hydroxyacyl-CoA dehydrogenase family protein [Bacteroidales bacterium]|nr:3-hydroxyacyl-CoA dehydrogenase family protein [Bacteroidales bacterium]
MMQEIKKVGIIGGGKMGTSLFNYMSSFNIKIVWYRRSHAEKAEEKNKRKLERQLKNNIITQESFKYRIENQLITADIHTLATADLIIECIKEDKDEKIDLFRKLSFIVKKTTIFASNSSSISPSEIGSSCSVKNSVIGLHFFYPVELKNIVELIVSNNTDTDVIKTVEQFLIKINKFYLLQDQSNAFILNKIMLKVQATACFLAKEKNLTYAQLDFMVRKELFPMGVFETMDQIGIDVLYHSVMNYMPTIDNPHYYKILCDHLQSLYNQQKLGIKTGCGFYNYNTDSSSENKDIEIDTDISEYIIHQLKAAYNNAIETTITENKCNQKDLHFALEEYNGTGI